MWLAMTGSIIAATASRISGDTCERAKLRGFTPLPIRGILGATELKIS